jgi:hypothetical protein
VEREVQNLMDDLTDNPEWEKHRHGSCTEYCPYCDAIQLGIMEDTEHEELFTRFVDSAVPIKLDALTKRILEGVSRVFRKKGNE